MSETTANDVKTEESSPSPSSSSSSSVVLEPLIPNDTLPTSPSSSSSSSTAASSSSSSSESRINALVSTNRKLTVDEVWTAILSVLQQWREGQTRPDLLVSLYNTDQLLAGFAQDNPGVIERILWEKYELLQNTMSFGGPPAVPAILEEKQSAAVTTASPAGEATKRTQSTCLDVLFIESSPYFAFDTSRITIQTLYERGPLAELMSKLNAEKMLDWTVRISHSLRFTNRQYALKLASYFYQKADIEKQRQKEKASAKAKAKQQQKENATQTKVDPTPTTTDQKQEELEKKEANNETKTSDNDTVTPNAAADQQGDEKKNKKKKKKKNKKKNKNSNNNNSKINLTVMKGIIGQEVWDSLNFAAFKTPLPNILPPDDVLVTMTPDQIVAAVANYTNETPEHLVARLRPNGESQTGFIGAEEHLGELILSDCKLLRSIGVRREEIAERMEMVMKLGGVPFFDSWINHLNGQPPSLQRDKMIMEVIDYRQKARAEVQELFQATGGTHPWKVIMHQYVGFQTDPFHPTMDNPAKENGRDYYVAHVRMALKIAKIKKLSEEVDSDNKPKWPQTVSLFFPSLAPFLIRRACFFEGKQVVHRIDPLKACKILGLMPDMRWDPKPKKTDAKK